MEKLKDWAGCLIPMVAFIFFVGYMFYANGNNEKKKEDKPSIGKYVYIDTNKTLHIKSSCIAIGEGPSNDELSGANRAVGRVLTDSISASMLYMTCSRCVSDKVYEELKRIARK